MAIPQSKEKEVFTVNYAKFCSTLTDIENLLKYFVEEKVINVEDLREINSKIKVSEKVSKLLQHISGPMEGGNSKGLYTLLHIMERHGTQATKDLANRLLDTLKELSAGKKKNGDHKILCL